MRADEPLPRDAIGRSVGIEYHEALLQRIGVVTVVLRANFALFELLERGNLPEYEPDTHAVHALDHRLRIGPRLAKAQVSGGERFPAILQLILRAVPEIERRLVAPRFDDERGCGIACLFDLVELLLNLALALPAVGGDPRAKRPVGRQHGLAGHVGKLRNDLARRAVEEKHVVLAFRQRDLNQSLGQGKHHSRVAPDKHAMPVVAKEERQRKVGVFALMGEFLDDGRLRRFAHAVHAVEALAHAIGNRGIAVIDEHAAPALARLAERSDSFVVCIVYAGHICLSKRPREGGIHCYHF